MIRRPRMFKTSRVYYGVLTQEAQPFHDQCEVDEPNEHHIELFEPCKDALEAFQPTEEPLNFVTTLIERFVVLPRLAAILFGWNDRSVTQSHRQLSRFLAFVGFIH